MKAVFLSAIVCVLGLSIGCGSTLKPVTLDPTTGRFPTQTAIPDSSVKINKPYDSKYRKLIYLKSDAKEITPYHKFFKESLENMHKFDTVGDKEYFEQLIIQKNLSDKVSNISDLVGLHNLAKEIGPFLVVEPTVLFKGGYNFSADLKAIDPENGQVLIEIHHDAFNWSGLDEPLFYPLLNRFMDWVNAGDKPAAPAAPAAPSPSPAPQPAPQGSR